MSAAASRGGYSAVSVTLHWLIALLIVGNLAGGFLMEGFLDSPDPAERQLGFQIVQLHKSSGLLVLVLSLIRLLVRLAEGFAPHPSHMTPTERLLARLTHWGFYVFMIAIPLAGWVMVSASPLGFPTIWFGLFEWPHLPTGTDKELSGQAAEVHELLAFGAIGLLVLHVAAALKHHWFDRDEVLSRMLPLVRRR